MKQVGLKRTHAKSCECKVRVERMHRLMELQGSALTFIRRSAEESPSSRGLSCGGYPRRWCRRDQNGPSSRNSMKHQAVPASVSPRQNFMTSKLTHNAEISAAVLLPLRPSDMLFQNTYNAGWVPENIYNNAIQVPDNSAKSVVLLFFQNREICMFKRPR